METEVNDEGYSLDDFLDGNVGVDEDAPVETPAGDEPEAPPTTEATGEEDAPPASEESTEDDEPQMVPAAALADERGKRQAQSDEIAELRQQLQAMQGNQSEPVTEPEEPIDFLADPDGWRDQVLNEVRREITASRQETQKRFLSLVENAAKDRHTDYEEVVPYFAEAAKQNPQLAQEMLSAGDPAEFAYQTGRRLRQLAEGGGDLDALIAREREAAVKEYIEQNPAEAEKPLDVPTSLSKSTAASGSASPKDPGDPSLQELFD